MAGKMKKLKKSEPGKKEKFRFLKHTADAKIEAYGKTMEDAFKNAAFAAFSLMVDVDKVKPKLEKKIAVKGNDEKALLYNWLEELLFLLDSEGFLLSSVKEMKISGSALNAVVSGDHVSEKYDTHGEVKAATYNEMEIKKEKGSITLRFVLDL